MFIGNSTNVMTPCIGQCVLDDEKDICTGCYRTATEIATWVDKSEDEKLEIVIRCKKQIAQRAKTL